MDLIFGVIHSEDGKRAICKAPGGYVVYEYENRLLLEMKGHVESEEDAEEWLSGKTPDNLFWLEGDDIN